MTYPITKNEVEAAHALLGVGAAVSDIEQVVQQMRQQIKIVKPVPVRVNSQRRDNLLRRIGNAQSEIGRLNKLLDEIRADVLHLTTE